MALKTLGFRTPPADTSAARPPKKTAAPFYSSPEWRALIARLIAVRGRRCERQGCGRQHCRIYGDHVVELADGGEPLEETNIELLCGSCHTAKTAEARARRHRGAVTEGG